MLKIKKITLVEWIMAFSCILLQYKSYILSYGLILLFVSTIFLFSFKKKIVIDKNLFLIGIIIFFHEIITVFSYNNSIERVLKNCISIFIIIFICSQGQQIDNKESFYRKLKVIAIISTFAIFIQSFQIYFLNKLVNPIILIPQEKEVLSLWALNSNRPSGFFSESQVYSSFMIPILIIGIEKKDFKFSVLLSLGIILSGSSLGIIMLTLLWGIQIFKSNMKFQEKIILLILVVFITIAFLNIESFSNIRYKLLNIFNQYNYNFDLKKYNEYSYSNYMRLLKSWITFSEIPLKDKLLGIGINNLTNFINLKKISFSWFSIWKTNSDLQTYYTTAGGIFIELGLIVGSIYYSFFIKNYKKQNNISKFILLCIVVQGFSTQIFFNSIFIYNLLLYFSFKEIYEAENINISLK